ncbi:MAG: hypothetical protein LKM44_01660 [Wolbachia endosymbiont of Meromenopon meropis]|nr:hypothetical protein [Wolbachia endosymbiont of Meromenopon meropis]
MPRNADYIKRTYGDNTVPGGKRIDLGKINQEKIDDLSTRWKKKEEKVEKTKSVLQSK